MLKLYITWQRRSKKNDGKKKLPDMATFKEFGVEDRT
jgi:hypothetical protein